MFYPKYTIVTNLRVVVITGANKFRAIANAQLAEDEHVLAVDRTHPKQK